MIDRWREKDRDRHRQTEGERYKERFGDEQCLKQQEKSIIYIIQLMVNYAADLKTQFYVLTLKYYCSTLNKNVYIMSSFVFF